MKPRNLVLVAVIGTLWGPGSIWAQGVDGARPQSVPQTSIERLGGRLDLPPNAAGSELWRSPDTGLPNRRIPSPVPPDPNEGRPVTPDTWLKDAASHSPGHPGKTPKDEVSREAAGSVDGRDIEEPVQRPSDAETPASTQSLNSGAIDNGNPLPDSDVLE